MSSTSHSNDGGLDAPPPRSLSIEEMNKLRIQQGLKPLYAPRTQKPPQKDEATKKKEEEEEEKARKAAKEEEERRMRRAKEEKDDDEIMPSLGEMLMKEEGENTDLSAWVAKSRASEKQQRLERIISRAHRGAPQDAQNTQSTPQDYGEDDLQGLKVAHDLSSALGDGEEMVLTLADAPILKDGELNEDEDVLENTELREQERWEQARAAAQAVTYDKYGDWEFEELRKGKTVPHSVRGANTRSILPQYDGIDSLSGDLDINSQNRTLYTIGNTCPKGADDIMKRLKALDNNNSSTSAIKNEDGNEDSAPVVFKKSAAKKDKKKVSAQRKMQLSIEALIGEVNAAETGTGIDQKSEHGSRAARRASQTRKKEAEDMVREMEIRQKNYERVVERSRKKAFSGPAAHFGGDVIDEEENNFYKTLSAATAAKAKSAGSKGASGSVAGGDLVSKVKRMGSIKETDWSQKYGNGVVVSQVTEFVKNVKNEDENENRMKFLPFADAVKEEPADDTAQHPSTQEPSLSLPNAPVNANGNNDDKDEDEGASKSAIFGSEEPLYSEGLGATLKLLQQKGGIEKVEREMEYQIGRSKDGEFQRNKKGDRILLEYTDEDGNALKPKEAFRQLSHIFHGRNPNKKKMAKIQKKIQEEKAKVNMLSTDTPLQSTEALRKITERLHQPYMVLTGSRATEQFTDERSKILNKDELKRKSSQDSSASSKKQKLN